MPRFSLRDLFWLTLVVAMGVGWWVSDRDRVQQIEVTEIEAGDVNRWLAVDGAIKETRMRNSLVIEKAYRLKLAELGVDVASVPLPELEVVPYTNPMPRMRRDPPALK